MLKTRTCQLLCKVWPATRLWAWSLEVATPTHLLLRTMVIIKQCCCTNLLLVRDVIVLRFHVIPSGTVWSWGDGDFGKLGRGGSEGSKVPKMIPNFGDVLKIRCGRQFSVALTRDGKVFSW